MDENESVLGLHGVSLVRVKFGAIPGMDMGICMK